MGILKQKANGNAATDIHFATPTGTGHTVLVLIGDLSGLDLYVGYSPPDASHAGDDAGNFYQNTGSTLTTEGGTNAQTDAWFIQTATFGSTVMPPNPGIQNVRISDHNAQQWAWIYELDCDPVTNNINEENAVDLNGGASDPGHADIQTDDLGTIGSSYGGTVTPDVTGDFIAVIIATASGITVTPPAGWTADSTVTSGAAKFSVFYREAPNGEELDYHFTPSTPSAPYAISVIAMASAAFSAGGPTTGNIVVTKQTVPSGDPQSFTLTPSWGAPFTLTDGHSRDSGPLTPGVYSVIETGLTGWDSAANIGTEAISVAAGETVNVLFTNTFLGTPGGGGIDWDDPRVMPWLVSISDLAITVNDLDGGADLADLVFTVQDRRNAITADFPTFIFEGKPVRLLAGFDGMQRADFVTLFTGKMDSVESTNANTEYIFTAPDIRQELSKVIYTQGDDGLPTDSSHPRTLNANPFDILLNILEVQVGLDPSQVDEAKITQYRDTIYPGIQFEFTITSPPAAKDFIENELMKPLGGYIWSNNLGQVTVNFYYPLTPDSVFDFNRDNLIEIPEAGEADLINEVSVRFDYDSQDKPQVEIVQQDAVSVAKFGQFGQHIIESRGLRAGLQGSFLSILVGFLIFLRYGNKQLCFGSNASNTTSNPVNALWSACLIEPGDIVTVTHSQVPDRTLGVMGITGQTFVVMDRTWQFFECLVQLKLVSIDLSKFKQYLITPNAEVNYNVASSTDQNIYMFQSSAAALYSNGDAGHTLA